MAGLSIVVPTFGRQELIQRQIDFWSNEAHVLVILDGSPNPWEPQRPPTATSGAVRFRYVHRPTPIEERLRFSISLIETPFVAMLSDDEFFIPSALDECVEFLRENPEFSSCKGGAVGFRIRDGQPQLRRVYNNLPGLRIEAADGRERMRRHLSPYVMASLWSVQRRNIYAACVKSLGEPPFGSAAAPEVAISLINSYLGNVAVLNCLMWLRSAEYQNIWWNAGPTSFAEWWLNAPPDEALRFTRGIQDSCQEIGESKPSSGDIHGALNEYCNQQSLKKPRRVMKRVIGFIRKAAVLISTLLPPRARTCILDSRLLQGFAQWRKVEQVLDDLEANGMAVDRDKVILTLRFVQKWHLSNNKSVSHH